MKVSMNNSKVSIILLMKIVNTIRVLNTVYMNSKRVGQDQILKY
jgi:hypothetical protein